MYDIITEFSIFFDNSLFAEIDSFMKLTTATSIDSLYLVFGYLILDISQILLNLDKYVFLSGYSHSPIQLSKSMNTWTMFVHVTDEKRKKIIKDLIIGIIKEKLHNNARSRIEWL